jgi:Golgi phosphoprotein 3 (GPP34)
LAVTPDTTAPAPRLHHEYFLLAHDGYTGTPHIDSAVLASGLAGALLGELLISRHIAIDSAMVRLRDAAGAGDPVADLAIDAIGTQASQGCRPVRWWVQNLRQSAYPLIGEQLTSEGLVCSTAAGFLRRSARYVANDPLVAARARVTLRRTAEVTTSSAREPRTLALAALALVTGMERVIADAANRVVRDGLRAMAGEVPDDMRGIVAAVDATVMGMATATRRGR